MIKVVGRIVGHSEPPHNLLGTEIPWNSDGDNFL